MTVKLQEKEHPAKFNDDIMWAIRTQLAHASLSSRVLKVFDPFAGVGGIHELRKWGLETWGLEIEAEWAHQSEHTRVGNILDPQLRFEEAPFDAIVTSPCYGNRMADHHNAQERCRACKGEGGDCEKCGGLGRRQYKRNTYRHALGRELSDGNSGAMPWGEEYRDFHRMAWERALSFLGDNPVFILNCKDHIRKGERQFVTLWHVETLLAMGLELIEWVNVPCTGNGFGANRDKRVPFEHVVRLGRP